MSIGSEAEQGVLVYLLGKVGSGNYWIGGTDEEVEDDWRWNDGSAWSYTNWDDDFPNGGSLKNCISTHKDFVGKWRDTNCYDLNSYVCKIQLALP